MRRSSPTSKNYWLSVRKNGLSRERQNGLEIMLLRRTDTLTRRAVAISVSPIGEDALVFPQRFRHDDGRERELTQTEEQCKT